MSVLPNTVCRRCHRQYASYHSSCPYCGTKRPREVRRSVPESDSAVRGTPAARRVVEDINWQTVIGAALLICVMAAVIAVVSVNVRSRVDETAELNGAIAAEELEARQVAAETTAIPVPTPTPEPTPTPVAVTAIEIVSPVWNYESRTGFMEGTGTTVDLDANVYPLSEGITVKWSSTDDSIASVDDTGLVTVTGTNSGDWCDIVASAGGQEATCRVWVR